MFYDLYNNDEINQRFFAIPLRSLVGYARIENRRLTTRRVFPISVTVTLFQNGLDFVVLSFYLRGLPFDQRLRPILEMEVCSRPSEPRDCREPHKRGQV